MPLAALIFDLDGTLVDTNAVHVAVWQDVFGRFGYAVSTDRIRARIGMGGDQLIPDLLGQEVDHAHGEAMRKAHKEGFADRATPGSLKVLPGAEGVIIAARRLGLKTALATSSGSEYLSAIARGCEVDFTRRVDVSTDGSAADSSKPAPDLVQAALERLKVPAGDAVMVGDTPYDGMAARAAGVRFWGVACGGIFDAAALTEAGAGRVWPDPDALAADLSGLVGR